MICPPQTPAPFVVDWIDRHRHPVSFVLHMIGIPWTILGIVFIPVYLWLLSLPVFLLALALFVGGYLLQFLGHALDGTEPGEITALRKLFAPRPAVAPALVPTQVVGGRGA